VKEFDWGNQQVGAAQLAFALAYDVTEDPSRAFNVYRELKQRIIANLEHNCWRVPADKLLETIRDIEKEQRTRKQDDNAGKD
jgi:hypothetical protein